MNYETLIQGVGEKKVALEGGVSENCLMEQPAPEKYLRQHLQLEEFVLVGVPHFAQPLIEYTNGQRVETGR